MQAADVVLTPKALPDERRNTHATLVGAIAEHVKNVSDVNELTFVPGQQHPVYSDSEEVLWLALEQLMFVDAPEAGELPVVWFGYHVQSRFSGKREAQGDSC